MKKVTAIAASTLLLSTGALAEGFSGQAGLGYQTSSIDTNYGECWSECFGDQEPAGFAIEAQFNFGPGLFATLDYADTQEDEDMYSSNNKVSNDWTDTTVGFGYALKLNDASAVTFALEYSDVEFTYEWKNPGVWKYDADDKGTSLVIGAVSDVSDKLELGASISGGFAEGVEAYAQYALADHVAVKVAYSTKSYELGNFLYTSNGSPSTPSDENGDSDFDVDTQVFRVSALYTF